MLEGIIFLKCLTPDKASSQICSMSLQMVFLQKHFEILRNVEVNYIKKCSNWLFLFEWLRPDQPNGLKTKYLKTQ